VDVAVEDVASLFDVHGTAANAAVPQTSVAGIPS
jgi:hypothetical protein